MRRDPLLTWIVVGILVFLALLTAAAMIGREKSQDPTDQDHDWGLAAPAATAAPKWSR